MENKWIILYENKNKAVEYIKNTLSEYVDYDVEIYNKNKAEQYELNNCNIISVGTDKALDGYKTRACPPICDRNTFPHNPFAVFQP